MIIDLILLFDEFFFVIFPEQAEYATFANEMLKNQARKPDYKVAEVILITMVAKNHESFLPSKSELCFVCLFILLLSKAHLDFSKDSNI